MRFKVKTWKIGDLRLVRRFLFMPKEIKGDLRWLEFVTILQECHGEGYCVDECLWRDIRFVDRSFQKRNKRTCAKANKLYPVIDNNVPTDGSQIKIVTAPIELIRAGERAMLEQQKRKGA